MPSEARLQASTCVTKEVVRLLTLGELAASRAVKASVGPAHMFLLGSPVKWLSAPAIQN